MGEVGGRGGLWSFIATPRDDLYNQLIISSGLSSLIVSACPHLVKGVRYVHCVLLFALRMFTNVYIHYTYVAYSYMYV